MTFKKLINDACAWALIILAIIGGGCSLVMLEYHPMLSALVSMATVATIIWLGNKTSE
ncbi:MAG: hypothetical protein SV201_04960 [Pseudomonadota bacterium]|nr:hypothetical protein [Pseudomonadota bacterium]